MYICNDRLLTHMGCTEMRPCLCQTPCWLSSGQEALAAWHGSGSRWHLGISPIGPPRLLACKPTLAHLTLVGMYFSSHSRRDDHQRG